ncbi:MAG: SAM-dependent methyltransferase [Acidimicrobiales bacterium]|nr:SAM-dependent methyltransferase [Acidimicrobiales bacterium]MYH75606.1 SAM-dependent methyltransferase [Acidimicrobiales bacterium]MYK72445.1 SAM-dependent methyltransferase [Acidimicrobiales bacterium]
MSQLSLLDAIAVPHGDLAERASRFCGLAPYKSEPFCRRNWGGILHSLCSYQGKLKPSIAKFLIEWFTEPGDRVLDPMAGVGTIPLEARRQGRVGVGSDLSPLAASVTRAKLEPFDPSAVADLVADLKGRILEGPELSELTREVDVDFGLNGPIRSYFHEDTLREVLIARQAFKEDLEPCPTRDVVFSSLLHILHGNRPYALSRRSHPVTPLAPSGPFEYRGVIERLETRLARVLPELEGLASGSLDGEAYEADCREVPVRCPVDAVITSPPFARSLRFWSSNWLRLWFTGWDRHDFDTEPQRYIDVQQRSGMGPYRELARAMHAMLRPDGLFILHLGETARVNMAAAIRPEIDPWFEIAYTGRENVEDTETHGLRDKGATVAHWYLFARRRP